MHGGFIDAGADQCVTYPAVWPGEAQFLVSGPRRFTRVPWHRRGYLKEYARDHCVEDLLRFTAEAVAEGVLERDEVRAFFREDVIVPGGVELGVYPASFWLASTDSVDTRISARNRASEPEAQAIACGARV